MLLRRDEQRLVDEELSRLPEKDRHALTPRYLHDLSNEEIAEKKLPTPWPSASRRLKVGSGEPGNGFGAA